VLALINSTNKYIENKREFVTLTQNDMIGSIQWNCELMLSN